MFQCIVSNFIAAKEVKINVSGLTFVRGESSSGKSSTLKAIFAACTNTFSPSQVRWGTSCANIKMRFGLKDPIVEVERTKKGSPVVRFAGKEYSKINRSVPKEVEDYLNLKTIQIGNEKLYLNFFSQFQPPILHSFSQRRIAEILSASESLDDYNQVVKYLSSRKEQLRGSFNSIDSVMSSLKEEQSVLSKQLEAEQPLQSSVNLAYKELLGVDSRYESLCELDTLSRELKGCTSHVENLSVTKKMLFRLGSVTSALDTRVYIKGVKDSLRLESEILKRAVFARGSLLLLRDVTNRYVSLSSLQESVSLKREIESKVGSLSVLISEVSSTTSLLEGIQSKVQDFETLSESIASKNLISSMLNDLRHRAQGCNCPLCGSKLNEEDMNLTEIKEQLEKVNSRVAAGEKKVAVLSEKIREIEGRLGVSVDSLDIESEIKKLSDEKERLESEIKVKLDEIDKINL